jgi:hypothetical protein
MVRVVHGASCPWGELFVGRVVMGRVVHGASYPWGELSMGRVVHEGELSMGRVVHRVSCRGASFDGASCPWGEWSGNRMVSLAYPIQGILSLLPLQVILDPAGVELPRDSHWVTL